MTFTDNSDSTATITGTPLDAHVTGGTAITIQGVSGGETVQASYTISVTQVNDEPTLSATGASGTFTEGGSNFALFSSAAATDSDSQVVQTYEEIVITITNVVDEEEYIVIDGSDCDITAAATCVANTATNSGAAVVTMDSTTATLTWTGDGEGISEALMETLINALAYKNTDDSPSVANNRVVTITTLKDNGGTTGAGDDSVTVSIAATVTVANSNDDPVIANSDNTGTYTEDAGGTVSDTLVVTDADTGDTPTWSCVGCTDAGDTQTLTDTYGSWVLTEATGGWVYTPSDVDTDMDSLNDAEAAQETITATATDGSGATDTIVITITITGANDAPTSSTGSGSTDEDTLVTFATSDFSFSDVDDVDTAWTRLYITTLESTGDLECYNANGAGGAWADCAANDYVADGAHVRLTPATNSVADVTFSFKVYDSQALSPAYVFTTTVAAENDVPTWSGTAADVAPNEDVAVDITGSVIADVDDTSLDSMTISTTQSGTFTLASTSGLSFASGDGTDDSSMVFGGTIANINTAIATITWTSASNSNANAVLSLTANDGDGDSATDTVAITVAAVNDPPTSAGDTATVTEDQAYASWTASTDWGYSDTESSAMTQIKLASLPSNGVLTDDDEDACGAGTACAVDDVIVLAKLDDLFYTTTLNSVASDSFTFYVYDGAAWSTSTATMAISVTPVNDAPTVANAQDNQAVNEDAALSYQFNSNVFTDVDSGDSCTYTSTTTAGAALPSWLTFTANTRTYSGTPANGDVGTVNVRTTCTDDGNSAVNDDFDIVVSNTNDAPSNAGDTATVAEDTAYVSWTASSDWGYSDVDSGDAMTAVKLITLPSQGTLTDDDENACASQGTAACEANDVILLANLDDLFYTGSSNYNGQDTFTYQVYDGEEYSDTGTMTITITAANDAPSAGATADQTVYEDVAYSFATATSTDVDNDDLTITCLERNNAGSATSALPGWIAVSDGGSGSATISGTPASANLLGSDDSDSTYNVICTTTDDGAGTLTATDVFVITLTAVNDAPYLSGDTGGGAVDAGSVLEGAALSITLTATDEEGTEVTFAEGTTCPDWVTVTNTGGASTGTLTADASEITDARVGDHTCDITMSDTVSTTLDTYTITITGVNDEPTLTASGIGTGDFTEDGSNLALFTSAAAADSDATVTQTYLKIIVTVTNVADTSE